MERLAASELGGGAAFRGRVLRDRARARRRMRPGAADVLPTSSYEFNVGMRDYSTANKALRKELWRVGADARRLARLAAERVTSDTPRPQDGTSDTGVPWAAAGVPVQDDRAPAEEDPSACFKVFAAGFDVGKLGLALQLLPPARTVLKLLEGGAWAEKMGLRIGDEIVAV